MGTEALEEKLAIGRRSLTYMDAIELGKGGFSGSSQACCL